LSLYLPFLDSKDSLDLLSRSSPEVDATVDEIEVARFAIASLALKFRITLVLSSRNVTSPGTLYPRHLRRLRALAAAFRQWYFVTLRAVSN
jgi:hypothetical protein